MLTNTKRKIYIALFIVFGVLIGLLLHGSLELWYARNLITDFDHYSLGYTWQQWFSIHKYFSITLLILSIVFGYFQGRYWWRVVYEEKRLDPFFRWLKKMLWLSK